MNSELLIQAVGLEKEYAQGSSQLKILKGIDLQVLKGDAISIVGASGAGKSTLLHILGTLDRPTRGEVQFRGKNLFGPSFSESDLAKFRNKNLGFVFQFHHLLNEFTAYENMMMPGKIAGWSKKECQKRADELFGQLGMSHRKTHFPSELSGGEQQRVAIGRALFLSPEVLLADEPTGNLDSDNSLKIQQLFFQLKEELGITLIVVTHDREFASKFPRVLHMDDGKWV